MKRSVPAVLLVMLAAAGCSIKEDRTSCPCYVTLMVEDARKTNGVDWFIDAPAISMCGKLDEENGWREIVEVPRGDVWLFAATGAEGFLCESGGIEIPEGLGCPPVFLETECLDTRCNSLGDTVHLHKNYAEITIRGVEGDGLDYELVGNVCGYTLEGLPLAGLFRAPAEYREGGRVCCVPRQMDSSLRLETVREGKLLQAFQIGDYIALSGYDWTAEDLQDIDIVVDVKRSSVDISTSEWHRKLTFYIDF